MSISSINTNTAAIAAQQNISSANSATANEVAQLSSGNRIVQASTDVAALSVGTSLASQVNILNTSLTVASQGSSLLQVADGALAQIQSILQQQQSIATQAQSGSLSSTQLGFLDEQFQSLTQQINQLAGSTNFNGVTLLNGNIQGGANVGTNAGLGNGTKGAVVTIATIGTPNVTNDALSISIGGSPTLTFTATSDASATAGDVAAGTTATQEAANFAAALNASGSPDLANFHFSNSGANIQATYVGPAPAYNSTTGTFNIPSITTTAAGTTPGDITGTGTIAFNTVNVLANGAAAVGTQNSGLVAVLTGADSVGDQIVVNGVTFTSNAAPTGNQFLHGTSVATTTTNIVNALNSSTNAALQGITFVADPVTAGKIDAYYNGATSPQLTFALGTTHATLAGTFATNQTVVSNGSNGLGVGTTEAIGNTNGNIFVTGGTNISSATNNGAAIDLSSVYGNSSFVGAFGGTGTIGAIQAAYDSSASNTTAGVTLSLVVGNDTYTAAEVTNSTLSGTGPVAITFTGNNTTTGSAEGGSFTINLQGSLANVTNQTQASQLASSLNAGLSTVNAYQARNVSSYNNSFTATVGGSQKATLQGSTLTYTSNNFSNPVVSALTVSAPGTGQTDASITAVINGQTYSTISGIGDTFKTGSQIVLENQSNPSQQLVLTSGNTAATGAATGIAIDLSSASNAAAFQTALGNALGLNNAGAGLTFQVGSSTTNTIGVSIGSSTSSSLFGGATLDVKTQQDAATAANTVQTALNTVGALRANVGALEQRFTYASNAISSAAQNEGAAQSALLDTDVAATSTQFATSQVQLQAGIAVLAQANQLQQNLLKLIA